MKVVYSLNKINLGKSVVTIGLFDGVHKAHQELIRKCIKRSKKIRAKSVVLTFWPYPAQLFNKDLHLLTSLEHKIELIRELGCDYLLILRFTKKLAGISGEEFFENILLKKLKAKEIYLGEDFKFGKNRSSSVKDLIKNANEKDVKVGILKTKKFKGRKISSSLIRQLIKKYKFKEAKKLLGRDFSLVGTVVHGDSRGRLLGYPTANLKHKEKVLPPDGIYAVELDLEKKHFSGICYVGNVPTFDNERKVEVHLFNYNKKIYHKKIEIKFLRFIRKSKKFSYSQELIKQIQKDINSCKKYLSLK